MNRILSSTKNIYILLTVIGLVRFINLGSFELQQWDESLYAVRAKSIVYHNDWLDQTKYSVDGLYSSSHPPLYAWLTGITYMLFGINEFSTRLFSALAGMGSIFVIFLIGKKLWNREVGILSAMILGFSPFFTFWTRQGQFDALLTFFISLSFYFYIESSFAERKSRKESVFLLLCGISTGLGLMTKLFVAIIIPLTVIAYELIKNKKLRFKYFLFLILIPALFAIPWHLFMTLKYGNGTLFFFLDQSEMIKRTFSGIEGNAKQLGIFYYLNQMMVSFPFIILFFIFGLKGVFRDFGIKQIIYLWFFIYFIIITTVSTKLAVYLLPLLIPFILLGSNVLFDFINNQFSKKINFILLFCTNFLLFWSIDHGLRMSIKTLFSQSIIYNFSQILNIYYPILFSFIISSLIIYFIYKNNIFSYLNLYIFYFCFLAPAFLITFSNVTYNDRIKYNFGIKDVVNFINSEPRTYLISIGNGTNPQLSFYLNGLDIGWYNTNKFIRLEPKNGVMSIKQYLNTVNSNDIYILVEKEEIDPGGLSHPHEIIPAKYINIFETRGYSLYK